MLCIFTLFRTQSMQHRSHPQGQKSEFSVNWIKRFALKKKSNLDSRRLLLVKFNIYGGQLRPFTHLVVNLTTRIKGLVVTGVHFGWRGGSRVDVMWCIIYAGSSFNNNNLLKFQLLLISQWLYCGQIASMSENRIIRIPLHFKRSIHRF